MTCCPLGFLIWQGVVLTQSGRCAKLSEMFGPIRQPGVPKTPSSNKTPRGRDSSIQVQWVQRRRRRMLSQRQSSRDLLLSQRMMSRTSGESFLDDRDGWALGGMASRYLPRRKPSLPDSQLVAHSTGHSCRDKRIFSTGCAGTRSMPQTWERPDPDPQWALRLLRSAACGPELAADPEPQHKPAAPQLMDAMVDENAKMTDCYYEKKDWRACKDEVC
jgi:hypothetical protein